MPVNLNLLPPELAIDKRLRSLIKTFRALGVIGVTTLLLFCIVILAIFVTSSISLKNTKAKIDSLKKQVAALEKTEQQVYLLKDRLAKIKSVQSSPNVIPVLSKIDTLLLDLSSGISVKDMKLTPEKVDLAFEVNSNSGLKALIGSLSASDVFSSISLDSFSLNPASGYVVETTMSVK